MPFSGDQAVSAMDLTIHICAVYRQCVEDHIDEELRAVLPKEEGRPVEKPAEAALRQRM